jgi:crossover junction endodeoxyribonuclease RuvC
VSDGLIRILGIDPGSNICGYGVIEAERIRLTYVAAGVITTRGDAPKYARIAEIGAELETLIAEVKPTVLALEAGFVRGQMGALVSGAARGVAAYVGVRAGLPVFEYAPATVKQAVTTAGNAAKESVARMVQLHLGLRVTPVADAADALAVAIAHARRPPGAKPVG